MVCTIQQNDFFPLCARIRGGGRAMGVLLSVFASAQLLQLLRRKGRTVNLDY